MIEAGGRFSGVNIFADRRRPDVSTYALMPIGYPQGKFGPLARKPVSEVTYADRWGVVWPN
jgi:hypothetical protein